MNPGLIILAGAGIAFYAHLAGLAYRSEVLRTKARYPNLPINSGDKAFFIVMAILWPLGWPASYTVLPPLRRYSAPGQLRERTRPDASRTDAWATAELKKRFR